MLPPVENIGRGDYCLSTRCYTDGVHLQGKTKDPPIPHLKFPAACQCMRISSNNEVGSIGDAAAPRYSEALAAALAASPGELTERCVLQRVKRKRLARHEHQRQNPSVSLSAAHVNPNAGYPATQAPPLAASAPPATNPAFSTSPTEPPSYDQVVGGGRP